MMNFKRTLYTTWYNRNENSVEYNNENVQNVEL